MKPQDLIAAFDTLAEAPDGVKRLRALVLQLAMRGRLVPQDPDDEPSGVLLDQARQDRARLIAEKFIRRRSAGEVQSNEQPFEIPPQWSWTRIWFAAHDLGQGKPKSRFSYVDVSAIDKERGVISGDVAILNPEEAPSRARKRVARGCVIYSTVRPYLRNIAVVDRDFDPPPVVSTAFSVLMPYPRISARYLYYYLRSPAFVNYVEAHQKGVAYPAINDGDFQLAPVPIPPSAEQKRIVARVDELMGLLDELEAARQAREATRTALRDSVLAALRDADTSEEVENAWERIAGRMDDLFTAPADVEPLRQTVLQLAVRGWLVPQDPDDEPACLLLERIAEEKARLVKEQSIRKSKPLPPVSKDEVPFEVPNGWVWTRFGTITNTRLGKMLDKAKNSGPMRPYLRNANLQWFKFLLEDLKQLRLEESELTECSVGVGDLLICEGGEPGRATVCDESVDGMVYQKALHRARPLCGISPWYLAYLLRCDTWSGRLAELFTGATIKHLTGRSLASYTVPLPPLAEQKRIVARVDQLMSLLDRLEQRLASKTTAHDTFAAAVVHHLDA
ncbi:MAG TPA: restriction endonuclease subunit S [Acidobacteriota bacterium]|nr:restriction endonuclease subunit S [Acidobacteriota bacterium]